MAQESNGGPGSTHAGPSEEKVTFFQNCYKDINEHINHFQHPPAGNCFNGS